MDIIMGHYSEVTSLYILFELSKYITPQYKFVLLLLSLFFSFWEKSLQIQFKEGNKNEKENSFPVIL